MANRGHLGWPQPLAIATPGVEYDPYGFDTREVIEVFPLMAWNITGNGALVAVDQWHAAPVWCGHRPRTVESMTLRVHNPAAGTALLALFTNNLRDANRPDELLAPFGSFDTSTGGDKTVIGPRPVVQGWVWAGVSCSSTSVSFRNVNAHVAPGLSTYSDAAGGTLGYRNNATTGYLQKWGNWNQITGAPAISLRLSL